MRQLHLEAQQTGKMIADVKGSIYRTVKSVGAEKGIFVMDFSQNARGLWRLIYRIVSSVPDPICPLTFFS